MLDQSFRNNLTIIITLHERKTYINRVLAYYKNFGGKIIIADSSKESSDFKQDGIEYVHWPAMLYYEKMYKVLQMVKTDYVVELPDDDFVLHGAIDRCLKYIINDPLCVAIQGQVVRFDDQQCAITKNYRIKAFVGSLGNKEEDVLDRVQYLAKTFLPWNHAIIKTSILKGGYGLVLNEKKLFPIRYYDEILGLYLAINGRIKTLPILYMMRSYDRMINPNSGYSYPKELSVDTPLSTIFEVLQSFRVDPLSSLLIDNTGINISARKFIFNYFRRIIKNANPTSVNKIYLLFSDLYYTRLYFKRYIPSYNKDYQEEIARIFNCCVTNRI